MESAFLWTRNYRKLSKFRAGAIFFSKFCQKFQMEKKCLIFFLNGSNHLPNVCPALLKHFKVPTYPPNIKKLKIWIFIFLKFKKNWRLLELGACGTSRVYGTFFLLSSSDILWSASWRWSDSWGVWCRTTINHLTWC